MRSESENNLFRDMFGKGWPVPGDAVVAMNTPISLGPRHRQFSYDTSNDKIIEFESEYKLFHSLIGDSLSVGQLAAAFAIVWFNRWDTVTAVLRGQAPLVSLNMSNNLLVFMRYLKHVVNYGKMKQHTLMVALLYLCRYSRKCNNAVARHPTSEARILITALMIADKHEDDISYSSSIWSRLGNIDLSEIRKMEIEFLKSINFDLHISSSAWVEFNQLVYGSLFPLVDSLLLS